jgi:glycine dehydrogenase subunit 1
MRYIPSTSEDRVEMLREIGVSSLEDLLAPIPQSLRLKRPLNLPKGRSEFEVTRLMETMAQKNLQAANMVSFLGAGSYDHFIPAVISSLSGRSEFLTAYTPYQPEVSQGTLQVIYEFQSMICELYGMDAANASVYDGGTALAEATMLATAHTKRKKILWADSIHPHYRKVAQTIAHASGTTFELIQSQNGRVPLETFKASLTDEIAAVVLQYPNFFGVIENLRPYINAAHEAGALVIVSADPLSMGVMEAPGHWNADIVIGEGQGLGNPQLYGGPYLGLFSVKEKLVRLMPGRIVGITKDVDGHRGYVLTLQTREQHIRREKATSNICTNEGLCATRAAMYMSLIGPKGLRQLGEACMNSCQYLKSQLKGIDGATVLHDGPHFKEFALRISGGTSKFLEFMAYRGILPGIPLSRFYMQDDVLLVAVTECRTMEEMDRYVACVRDFCGGKAA